MYLNAICLVVYNIKSSCWTLTWDVFKSGNYEDLSNKPDCWTLTWDVFKWNEIIRRYREFESWTLTWDVFK